MLKLYQFNTQSIFFAVIYGCIKIPPRHGVRGRVTAIGIVSFEEGFEVESLYISSETDFDLEYKAYRKIVV